MEPQASPDVPYTQDTSVVNYFPLDPEFLFGAMGRVPSGEA